MWLAPASRSSSSGARAPRIDGTPGLAHVSAVVNDHERQRAWVSQAVAADLVRRVAPLLAAHGVPVLPVKGVWLQALVYPASVPRPVTDVDLLVAEPHYQLALRVLIDAGWTVRQQNVSESALVHADHALPLD